MVDLLWHITLHKTFEFLELPQVKYQAHHGLECVKQSTG